LILPRCFIWLPTTVNNLPTFVSVDYFSPVNIVPIMIVDTVAHKII